MMDSKNDFDKISHWWRCMNCNEMTYQYICTKCGKPSYNEDTEVKCKDEIDSIIPDKSTALKPKTRTYKKLIEGNINNSKIVKKEILNINFKFKKLLFLNAISLFLILILEATTFIQYKSIINSYENQSAKIIEKNEEIENLQKENIALKEKALNSQSDIKFILHSVKQNENLVSICKAYNIDYYANKSIILSLNSIKDQNMIFEGQKLILPLYE